MVRRRAAGTSPQLVEWIEDAVPEMTTHMELATGLEARLRSNTLLESLSKELRLREDVVGIFPNHASSLRQITAMAVEKGEERRGGKR